MTHYKQLPKSALIKNSVEVQNYLKTQYGIQNLDYVYESPETHPWLMVAISNSHSGYLYYRQSFYTQADYIKYLKNNPFTKEFPNAATLYKYIDQCKLIKKLTY